MKPTTDNSELFAIERTSVSLIEAGKKVGASFLMLSLFLVLASILTFSESSVETVKVPFLELNLERWLAAQIVVMLSSAVFFRLASLHTYERLLYTKLHSLTNNQSVKRFHWYAFYPSIYFFIEEIGSRTPTLHKAICYTIYILLLLGAAGYPIYLLYRIGSITNFPLSWFMVFFTTLFLLFGSFITLFGVTRGQGEELISEIEKEESW